MSTFAYYDMHCHTHFAGNCDALVDGLAAAGIFACVGTVCPSDYVQACQKLEGKDNVTIGLGLHPWWVEDGRAGEAEICAFEAAAKDATIISEVGLDFSGKHKESAEAQEAAFARVCAALAQGGKLVILHAPHAANRVVEMLDAAGALDPEKGNTFVLHGFTDQSVEIKSAKERGFMMTVSLRNGLANNCAGILATYPAEKMLLETDAPNREMAEYQAAAQKRDLETAGVIVAPRRRVTPAAFVEACNNNAAALLDRYDVADNAAVVAIATEVLAAKAAELAAEAETAVSSEGASEPEAVQVGEAVQEAVAK